MVFKKKMSVLNLVTKIIQIKNGQYRLTISDKKLLKVFGISALFLLTQISYSKKLRTWSINYFHAFVVGGSITMVFGKRLEYFSQLFEFFKGRGFADMDSQKHEGRKRGDRASKRQEALQKRHG